MIFRRLKDANAALQKANELKHLSRFLPFQEPAADLGCGDGTHSAMVCGARFHEDFDMYLSVTDMTRGRSTQSDKGIHFKAAQLEEEYYKGADSFLFFDKSRYHVR